MIMLAFLLVGVGSLVAIGMMPTRSPLARSNAMNAVTLVQSACFLAITLYILIAADLPRYYLSSRYFFVDALSVYEVLISSLVFLLAAIYARGYVAGLLEHDEIDGGLLKLFYGAFALLQIITTFSFMANNLGLFWILMELTTVVSAILIVTLKGKDNVVAALKYLFVASSAMLFSIVGLIIIYAMTSHAGGEGTLNWDLLMQQSAGFAPPLFTLAFVFIFIGFAAKSGVAPFHTAFPPAYAKAPSVVSALLAAVIGNIGIYGILRIYAVGYHTSAKSQISMVLFIFGAMSIVVAAFCILPRTNIKKVIAYSSIEHTGLILIGIGLGVKEALFWVIFHIMGNALVKSQLFFSAGILGHQYGGNHFDRFRNALRVQPLAVWGVILGSVAIIGTPLFPIFLSKFFILIQVGDRSLGFLAFLLLMLLLVAAGFAVFLIKAFTIKDDSEALPRYVAPWTMKAPILLLIGLTLVLGLYLPGFLIHMIDDVVACLGF